MKLKKAKNERITTLLKQARAAALPSEQTGSQRLIHAACLTDRGLHGQARRDHSSRARRSRSGPPRGAGCPWRWLTAGRPARAGLVDTAAELQERVRFFFNCG
jgi:hypothetical protein